MDSHDAQFAIDALTEENARLRRALEFIASSTFTDGYRSAFYALRWHARTTLNGRISPTRSQAVAAVREDSR